MADKTAPDSTDPRARRKLPHRRWLLGGTVVLGLLVIFAVEAPAAAFTDYPRTRYENSIARAVEQQVNAERHAHHLPALTTDSHLQSSAHRHDLAMASRNTMSHRLPGEASFAARITRAGYDWQRAGENIAWSSPIDMASVLKLQTMMFNEKPADNADRRNILSTHFHDVGVHVYLDRAHDKIWLTMDFGSR